MFICIMSETEGRMRIGIIGSGTVGQTLAQGLTKHKFEVMISTGTPDKQVELQMDVGKQIRVGSFADAADYGEAVILAVKGHAAEKIVEDLADMLSGKTVIDTTNPIDESHPPEDGVLSYFTKQNESLMERLQQIATSANFVKAFNSVGAGVMVDPKFATQPTMHICGDNESAKDTVGVLLKKIGWDVLDLGSARAAGAVESLCILWCITGFRENDWSHAYAYLRSKEVEK